MFGNESGLGDRLQTTQRVAPLGFEAKSIALKLCWESVAIPLIAYSYIISTLTMNCSRIDSKRPIVPLICH